MEKSFIIIAAIIVIFAVVADAQNNTGKEIFYNHTCDEKPFLLIYGLQ